MLSEERRGGDIPARAVTSTPTRRAPTALARLCRDLLGESSLSAEALALCDGALRAALPVRRAVLCARGAGAARDIVWTDRPLGDREREAVLAIASVGGDAVRTGADEWLRVPVRGRDGAELGVALVSCAPGTLERDDAAWLQEWAAIVGRLWQPRAPQVSPSHDIGAQLIELIPAPVWVLDPAGRPLYVNAKWREFFGAPEACWRTGWTPVMHPDDVARLDRHWKEHASRGEGYQLDGRFRRADGTFRWVRVIGRPVKDASGSVLRWYGVNVDIDDRVVAQSALADSEAQLAARVRELNAIFDVVPVGLCVAEGREFDTVRINVAMARLIGVPAEGPVSIATPKRGPTPWSVTARGRPVGEHDMPLQRAARGETVRQRLTLHSGLGTSFEVEGFAAPLTDPAGSPGGAVGVFVDVTDAVSAERRLQQFAQSDVIGILFGTADGGIEYANDEFLRIVGYRREDVAAGRLRWDALTPPEWLARDEQGIAEARRRGACGSYEKEYIRSDGARVPVLVGYILYGPYKERSVAFILDISDRKAAEEALRTADRRKDEFLATLAHELRGPLAPLAAGLQLLRRAPPDSASAERARAAMERQIGLLVRLVDDMMDMTQVRQGRLTLEREAFDLRAAIVAAVEMSRPAIDARRQHLAVRTPESPVPVRGDRHRLIQVFGNLLSNASKYTPEGGHIVIEASAAGGRCRVRCSDDGQGIPAHLLGDIFGLFAQAAPPGSAGHRGGLGIGLALARRLVELHGGSLRASSDGEGRGACFEVELPCDGVEAAAQS
jgi:PAS domain S-box-containing protein